VGGRPVLDWLLDRLCGTVSDACLIVDRLDGSIPRTFGTKRQGIRLHYALQPEPLGVGDAVLRAAGIFGGPFAVVMGDVYYDQPLHGYIDAWRRSGADGAVLTEPLQTTPTDPVGLVRVSRGWVQSIVKATTTVGASHQLCGMSILPESAFTAADRIRKSSGTGEIELESIVTWLIEERAARFVSIRYQGWRRNINTLEDLEFVRAKVEGHLG
jgi:dTDP-glucose pyrophosphorylase